MPFDEADLIALGNFNGMSDSLGQLSVLLGGSAVSVFWGSAAFSGCEVGGATGTNWITDFPHFFLRLGFGALGLSCQKNKSTLHELDK